MRARGSLQSCLVTIVMALAGFVTAGALPAVAAPSTFPYVALGDSYAAGTASQQGRCPHGPVNYPALLGSGRIVLTDNVACSGAKIQAGSNPLGTQLSALNGSGTRLVTLTVGAANLGLSGVEAVSSRTFAAVRSRDFQRPNYVGGLSGRRESARRRSHQALRRGGR